MPFDTNDLKKVCAAAAEPLLRYQWKVWFWGDSIGLEGLMDASAFTGDQKYFGFVCGLLAGWIARENHRSAFDYTAPGVALLRAYQQTQNPALLNAAIRHAAYMESFRRTTNGAWVRYEDASIELPPELPPDHPQYDESYVRHNHQSGGPCVFVDSMHFDGPFFARLYQVTGEDRYRKLALDNILPQIELLFDESEQLFHHFWMERSGQRNGVLWGRGNGWALLGLTSTLACLPPEDPGAKRLIAVLRALAGRLVELQHPCGGWHTILNDPASYIETSIAAFVLDGFSTAIRYGWLNGDDLAPVLRSALRFLLGKMREDGVLAGVSYETFPSTRPEHYRQMPQDGNVPWGQGPLLTALRSYTEALSCVPGP